MPWGRVERAFLCCSIIALLFGARSASHSTDVSGMSLNELPGRALRLRGSESVRLVSLGSGNNRDSTRARGKGMADRNAAISEEDQSVEYQQEHTDFFFYVKYAGKQGNTVRKQIREISEKGFLQYIPMDTFLVSLSRQKAHEVAALSQVQGVYEVTSTFKGATNLLSKSDHMSIPDTEQLHGTAEGSRATASERRGSSQSVHDVVTLDVLTHSHSPRAVHLEDWKKMRTGSLRDFVRRLAFEQGHITLEVDRRGVEPVVEWVQSRPDVYWVERRSERRLQERRFTEGESKLRNKYGIPSALGISAQAEPAIWSHGLRGHGQIISVMDTGLDLDSCFFNDTSSNLTTCAGSYACQWSGQHRKIAGYRLFSGASVGDEGGHGTHVAGSVAGDARNEGLRQHGGIAPDAKLLIEDFSNGVDNNLYIPDDLYSSVFPQSYAAGARVHTNSWGSSTREYSTTSMEVDRYMHEHPDFLVIFAVGNDGPQRMTVDNPANSKNAIAVGSSENQQEAYGTPSYHLILATPAQENDVQVRIVAANFGAGLDTSAQLSTGLVRMQPEDGCSSASNPDVLVGNVALLLRGPCSFQESAWHAQQAGAIAVVIANNVSGASAFEMPANPNVGDVSILAVMVGFTHGSVLRAFADYGSAIATLPSQELYSLDNLAWFSGRGPTTDMRFKPDVIAAGDRVRSAKSDLDLSSDNCQLETATEVRSGTSFAAPIVAGAAALVREYFEEGFHVSGVRDSAGGISPSAALVKAVLIHSGRQLHEGNGDPMQQNPTFDQGFGSVNLSSVLWFGPDSPFQLWVNDGGQVSDSEQVSDCFHITDSSQPLKVTLVWTDPPANPAVTHALINDLDLVVIAPSGKYKLGNALFARSSSGLDYAVADSKNNVEQVVWTVPETGSHQVRVTGFDVAVGTQAFSLVVTGIFSQSESCVADTCVGDGICSGNGECSAGRCVCVPTHTGHDCGVANGILKSGNKVLAEVKHSFWQLYFWDAPTPAAEWVLHVNSLHQPAGPTSTSRPELYLAWDRTPSLQDYDVRAVDLASLAMYNMSQRDVPESVLQLAAAPGRWVLGIYAYCCADARVELALSLPPLTTTTTTVAPLTTTTTAMAVSTSHEDIETTTVQELVTTAVDNPSIITSTPAPVTAPVLAMPAPKTTPAPQTAVPAHASSGTSGPHPSTTPPLSSSPPSDSQPLVAVTSLATSAPSAPGGRIQFTAALPFSLSEFLKEENKYIAGVSLATAVDRGNILVVAVREITVRRRLLALGVEVDTQIEVQGSLRDVTSVARGITTTSISEGMVQVGLPSVSITTPITVEMMTGVDPRDTAYKDGKEKAQESPEPVRKRTFLGFDASDDTVLYGSYAGFFAGCLFFNFACVIAVRKCRKHRRVVAEARAEAVSKKASSSPTSLVPPSSPSTQKPLRHQESVGSIGVLWSRNSAGKGWNGWNAANGGVGESTIGDGGGSPTGERGGIEVRQGSFRAQNAQGSWADRRSNKGPGVRFAMNSEATPIEDIAEGAALAVYGETGPAPPLPVYGETQPPLILPVYGESDLGKVTPARPIAQGSTQLGPIRTNSQGSIPTWTTSNGVMRSGAPIMRTESSTRSPVGVGDSTPVNVLRGGAMGGGKWQQLQPFEDSPPKTKYDSTQAAQLRSRMQPLPTSDGGGSIERPARQDAAQTHFTGRRRSSVDAAPIARVQPSGSGRNFAVVRESSGRSLMPKGDQPVSSRRRSLGYQSPDAAASPSELSQGRTPVAYSGQLGAPPIVGYSPTAMDRQGSERLLWGASNSSSNDRGGLVLGAGEARRERRGSGFQQQGSGRMLVGGAENERGRRGQITLLPASA